MKNLSFNNVNDRYYNLEKSRWIPLVSEEPNVILDLGCATGNLGRKLRESNKAKELVGVEIFEPAAAEASKHYDKVYQGDIETLDIDYSNHFDYILCGDILEHLRDPWSVLKKLYTWLKKDGVLIASVPNIRYWRILKDLILFGQWNYVSEGILDQTHLRFFTNKSFIGMMQESGFTIVQNRLIIHGSKQSCFSKITLNIFDEFLGAQTMVVARKKLN